MKSFSKRTKEMLCKQELGSVCCMEAEMMGILIFAGKFKNSQVRVVLESREAVERFLLLLHKCLGVKAEIQCLKSSYFCQLTDKRVLSKIVDYEFSSKNIKDCFIKSDCCRGAFLRGAFLGGGALTDPHKTYNIEFSAHSLRIHDEFKQLLQEMGLGYRSISKKNSYVLYSKNSDIICDSLAYMGAYGTQMEILNLKIEREVRSEIIRTSNGETANMDKVMEASSRHISAIGKIYDTIGFDGLSDELRELAILRMEFKDLSLDQLGKKLTPPLSKSGVNHRLKKLLEIAEKL